MLKEELKRAVDAYVSEYSQTRLAHLSGVSVSTIQRIRAGDAEPAYTTTMKLLGVVAGEAEARRVLKTYFPDVPGAIANGLEDKRIVAGGEANLGLRTTLHNKIFVMVSSLGGRECTRARIEADYGRDGLRVLDEFLQCEMMVESGGSVRLRESSYVFLSSPVDTLRQISLMIDAFDTSNLGTDRAGMASLSGAVNAEGLKQIKKALRDFARTITSIRENPAYDGDEVFYVGALSNVLNSAATEEG